MFTLFSTSFASATVETGIVVGTQNKCRNSTDISINFENGIEGKEVKSSSPNVEFTNSSGLDWLYADFRTGNYNTQYIMNGNFTTWLGVSGNTGRITFKGGPASYVSLLTKTYSGLEIDAYDSFGNHLANSGRAGSNVYSGTVSKLTVEAANIAYVEIHDSGNYWTVDDICTDAAPVCQPLPGHTNGDSDKRIDLVFVMDDDYDGDLTAFLKDVENKISNRLGAVTPTNKNLDKFNFYFTKLEGHVTESNSGEESSLPKNLLTQCPATDAVVILHKTFFGDATGSNGKVSIFSGEGPSTPDNDAKGSFIHESGHGLFGLRDEYDSNREYGDTACDHTNYIGGLSPYNIWATEVACSADAKGKGWASDYCYKFTTCQGDWWKIGNGTLADDNSRYADPKFKFIMKDGSHFLNGFGDPAVHRINWVLGQISSGKALGTTNAKALERSVVLNFIINEHGIELLETNFVNAKSPNYLLENNDFEAKVYSNNGSLIGKFGFNDPRLIQAEKDYSGASYLDEANFNLIFPLSSTIAKAEIIDQSTGEILITADLSTYATEQAIEGDLNDDGIVDRIDVNLINAYRNQPASANPGCDIDGDGTISILDARKLSTMCTYPSCASK
jgi:hypothetical protein